MDNDLVSVIVPFYNEEKRLNRCVKSIMTQSFSNLEIILVNNNSIDQSKEIAENIVKTDERIFLLDCDEQGVYAARNKGLNFVHGKYIAFVDADDCIPRDGIEILYNAAIEKSADLVVGARMNYDENMTKKKKCEIVPFQSSDKEAIHRYFLSDGMDFNQAWGKLYSKKLFEGVRFASFSHYEDIATLPLILENVSFCTTINRTVYNYCIRKNSLSSNYNIKGQYEGLKARLQNQQFYKDKYPKLIDESSVATLNFAFLIMGKIYKSRNYGKEWEDVLHEVKKIKSEKPSLGLFMSTVMHFSLLFPHLAAAMFCLYSKIKNRM